MRKIKESGLLESTNSSQPIQSASKKASPNKKTDKISAASNKTTVATDAVDNRPKKRSGKDASVRASKKPKLEPDFEFQAINLNGDETVTNDFEDLFGNGGL